MLTVLTSSRADYGIYRPLLRELRARSVAFEIVAFGSHLSLLHGKTITEVEQDAFGPVTGLETIVAGDSPAAVASSLALTIQRFAEVWQRASKRAGARAIALGDRYEMFAAATAAIPFNIPVAHIHGGETTLGAIDEVFRHSLSHMADLHFATCDAHAARITALKGGSRGVHNVGALGIDNLRQTKLLPRARFLQQVGLDPGRRYVLVTLHPETRNPTDSARQARVVCRALDRFPGLDVLITMPNQDTAADAIRTVFTDYAAANPQRVQTVDHLGSVGYFSAICHAAFLLGNSSSALIEAPSLHRHAVNVGRRQEGRLTSRNVIHVPFHLAAVVDAMRRAERLGDFRGRNIFGSGGAARRIAALLQRQQARDIR